jgi:hypothetical protein
MILCPKCGSKLDMIAPAVIDFIEHPLGLGELDGTLFECSGCEVFVVRPEV